MTFGEGEGERETHASGVILAVRLLAYGAFANDATIRVAARYVKRYTSARVPREIAFDKKKGSEGGLLVVEGGIPIYSRLFPQDVIILRRSDERENTEKRTQ